MIYASSCKTTKGCARPLVSMIRHFMSSSIRTVPRIFDNFVTRSRLHDSNSMAESFRWIAARPFALQYALHWLASMCHFFTVLIKSTSKNVACTRYSHALLINSAIALDVFSCIKVTISGHRVQFAQTHNLQILNRDIS